MAEQSSRRHGSGYVTKRAKAKDERTKFDKWFDEQIEMQTELYVIFDKNPALENQEGIADEGRIELGPGETYGRAWNVTPLVCDRYFLFLYFIDLEDKIWVAKSNILSVSVVD